MKIDLSYLALCAIGLLLILVIILTPFAIYDALKEATQQHNVIAAFCPEESIRYSSQEYFYCDGKPFVCTKTKCNYIEISVEVLK